MTYSLALNFYNDKEEKMPVGPRATIYLKQCIVDDQKRRVITLGDCARAEEVLENVERLKKELDVIGKEAVRKFKKANLSRSDK